MRESTHASSFLSTHPRSPCLAPPSLSLSPLVPQEYVGKLASSQAKGDDFETAAAQIGVEVYSAMNAAVGSA